MALFLSQGRVSSFALVLQLVLSQFGALLRYELGLRNAATPDFPKYTLIANLLGCALFGLMRIGSLASNSTFVNEFCVSVNVGFAGSLSTVSTLMSETKAFSKSRHRTAYVGATHLSAQLILFVINFPVWAAYRIP
jgi:fluoride ion exporter CrcB/FEX